MVTMSVLDVELRAVICVVDDASDADRLVRPALVLARRSRRAPLLRAPVSEVVRQSETAAATVALESLVVLGSHSGWQWTAGEVLLVVAPHSDETDEVSALLVVLEQTCSSGMAGRHTVMSGVMSHGG